MTTYWIGEKEMSYFVNKWRHLNISRVVLIASGHTIRRFEDDNLCYKCLFDSVVIVRFNLKLWRVKDGVQRARNSSYFTFLLLRGKNATKAAEKFCEVYGPNTVTIRTAQRWFDRFRSGVVDVEDTPRTGRPIVVETDKIVEIIQVDRHVSIRSIGQELGIDHKTVWNHLQKIGFQKSWMFGCHTS